MTLPKEFASLLDEAEDARRQNLPEPPLHIAVTGGAGTGKHAAAKDYARGMVERGLINKTPVEIDCDTAPSGFVGQVEFWLGQALGVEAQGGVIILDHAGKFKTGGEVTDRLELALENRETTVVLVDERENIEALFRAAPGLKKHFRVIDQESVNARMRHDAQAEKEAELHRAVRDATVLRQDIAPMKPLLAPPAKR